MGMTTLREHYFPTAAPTQARIAVWSGSDVWVGADSFLAARMTDRNFERRVREGTMTGKQADDGWRFGFAGVLAHLVEEQWRPQLERLLS
jgi:hypothetical protein